MIRPNDQSLTNFGMIFIGRLHLPQLFGDHTARCQQKNGPGRRGIRQQDVLPGGYHT